MKRFLIDLIFEILRKGLKGILILSVLLILPHASRAQELPADSPELTRFLKSFDEVESPPLKPRPSARAVLRSCYGYQTAGLLSEHEDCREILDDAGLLEDAETETETTEGE